MTVQDFLATKLWWRFGGFISHRSRTSTQIFMPLISWLTADWQIFLCDTARRHDQFIAAFSDK